MLPLQCTMGLCTLGQLNYIYQCTQNRYEKLHYHDISVKSHMSFHGEVNSQRAYTDLFFKQK